MSGCRAARATSKPAHSCTSRRTKPGTLNTASSLVPEGKAAWPQQHRQTLKNLLGGLLQQRVETIPGRLPVSLKPSLLLPSLVFWKFIKRQPEAQKSSSALGWASSKVSSSHRLSSGHPLSFTGPKQHREVSGKEEVQPREQDLANQTVWGWDPVVPEACCKLPPSLAGVMAV